MLLAATFTICIPDQLLSKLKKLNSENGKRNTGKMMKRIVKMNKITSFPVKVSGEQKSVITQFKTKKRSQLS